MRHVDDADGVGLPVDAVDHAVGAAACAVPIGQRRVQLLSDPVGVVQEWADDELVGGDGYRLG